MNWHCLGHVGVCLEPKCSSPQATTKSGNSHHISQRSWPSKVEVRQLLPNVIKATIITVVGKKEYVFITQMPVSPISLLFEFKWFWIPCWDQLCHEYQQGTKTKSPVCYKTDFSMLFPWPAPCCFSKQPLHTGIQ